MFGFYSSQSHRCRLLSIFQKKWLIGGRSDRRCKPQDQKCCSWVPKQTWSFGEKQPTRKYNCSCCRGWTNTCRRMHHSREKLLIFARSTGQYCSRKSNHRNSGNRQGRKWHFYLHTCQPVKNLVWFVPSKLCFHSSRSAQASCRRSHHKYSQSFLVVRSLFVGEPWCNPIFDCW